MSWKHAKFDDSAVFRSLEKIAQQKGMIKNSEIVKSAEKSSDLTPSNNLTDNVMKLCAGLRAQGFDNRASELESKFINYKRAETLYETSKEEGEDLVDAAHPKGSHKLEGVDGDATIETIIDQHLKLVEISNKAPTGKLSNNKDILKAVKMAFGQNNSKSNIVAAETMNSALNMALQNINKIYNDIFKDPQTKEGNKASYVAAVNPIHAELAKIKPFANPDGANYGESALNLDSANSSIEKAVSWVKQMESSLLQYNNEGATFVNGAKQLKRKEDPNNPFWAKFDTYKNEVYKASYLSQSAIKAQSGDMSGIKTKDASIPTAQIKSAINTYLIAPLQQLMHNSVNLDTDQIKDPNVKSWADSHLKNIDLGLRQAFSASKQLDANIYESGFFNLKDAANIFRDPIDSIDGKKIFVNLKNLESFIRACQSIISVYSKGLDYIQKNIQTTSGE